MRYRLFLISAVIGTTLVLAGHLGTKAETLRRALARDAAEAASAQRAEGEHQTALAKQAARAGLRRQTDAGANDVAQAASGDGAAL